MENSKIVEIFEYFKNRPDMHTDFYSSGCTFRTKAICDYMKNDASLKGEKIHFIKVVPEKTNQSIVCRNVQFKSKKSGKIKWTDHWVPIVYDEQNKPVVLDICLMDGPEYLSEWARNFANAKIEDKHICDANMEMDYAFIEGELYNSKSIKDCLEDPEYDSERIIPNTERSEWLKEHKTRVRALNRNQQYYLEVKEKLAKKKLAEHGLSDMYGKTGDSRTGEVSDAQKEAATIQTNVLKSLMIDFAGSKNK